MTAQSDELIRRLKSATATLEPARPRLLLGPGSLPDESVWGFMSLLAKIARRGEGARTARLHDR